MIVGVDATTLSGQLTGVGYYTARLIESLAAAAGGRGIEKIIVLSNREVGIIPNAGGSSFALDVSESRDARVNRASRGEGNATDPPPEHARARVEVPSSGRFPIRSVWMQVLLPRLLRELRPDLVHFTNYLAPASLETPYVLSIHDMTLQLFPECHTWKKRLLTSRLLPLVARSARLVLTPSESTRRDVVLLLGLDPGRVRVIPYAASHAFQPVVPDYVRLRGRYGVRPPYFLYVGTLEPRKNLPRTLRAFARVAASLPDHSFVLVGQRGWKYGATLREAARAELRDRVVFPGYVPEADLPGLMSGACAFVYPSLYEGFGLPVVEAMACGVPVLTSRSSSLAEIAEGASLLVDPLDEQALADGLHALATDGGLRERLAAQGQARAASFSWERTARQTASSYEEALRPPIPARASAPARDAGEAILRTVTYASLFQAPLSLDALHRTLMDVPLSRERLLERLSSNGVSSRVSVTDGYVHPAGREDWVEGYNFRRERTRGLLARHRLALAVLARFPYVRLVALSGACAHENASDDDVDLFLTVRPGRLWGVQLALMTLSKLFGLRRSLCLNYSLDEEALPLRERDVFTAAEIVGMRPLHGREGYLRFVASNPWTFERFPNFGASYAEWSAHVPPSAGAPGLERLLDLGPAQLFEGFARATLGAYLRLRLGGRAGVRLEPHVLKLHTFDHAPRILSAYEDALPLVDEQGALRA